MVVETALRAGLKTVKWLVGKARKFKPTLRKLDSTVKRLIKVVEELKQLEEEFGRPTEETERDLQELQEAEELVSEYSNLPRWKCCWFCFCQDKLQAMDDKVERLLQLLQTTRIALTRLAVEHGRRRQTDNPFKPPLKPELTVGFDGPLVDLKTRLLVRGTSVSVLTGLPGSGKTTLATLLCWDEEVRGKFRENILFVTVSKTPLKTIVETLCQSYNRNYADLGDEHMVRRLKDLLQEIGKSPLMLVLDDVWSASESLIDDFHVQLPDYKILVTSRFDFHGFGNPCQLKPLSPQDAVTLFSHFTKLPQTDDSVQRVARRCRGLPLALEVIGKSLRRQPTSMWLKIEAQLSDDQSVHDSDIFLNELKKCLDHVLEDEPVIMECFMDLGLFPENHKISVPALIDMWIELYKQVKDDIGALMRVLDLTNRNLAQLVHRRNRKVEVDVDMSYSNHFLMQHTLLREVAIHQSNQEPFEKRKRLMIDLSGNNRPEWWEGQNQQGIASRMLSFFPKRWITTDQKQVAARTLCISTDETFTSDWSNMLRPKETEVLVLNIRSSEYSLPEFTEIMSELNVLIVTNYGFHPSVLNSFELLGSLPDLKRIRLENVSVPCLCKLRNLQKLSLYMCDTSQAFERGSIQISDALPNLEEMNIDYCKDLVELPSDICNITTMKKLSITSCHRLSALPQEIGNLQNLELLRLSSCSELREIPESVGRLQKLRCLDISDSVSLILPEDIGDLLRLKKLHMWGCSNALQQLASSVDKFQRLPHALNVTCDDEVAALWEAFTTSMPNLRIKKLAADIILDWLA